MKKTYKIIIVGDKGTGKTSIVSRFVEDYYFDNTLTTIGVEMKTKCIKLNNDDYKLQLWDLSGNEKYYNIVTSYYKSFDAIIFTYDITNVKTANNLTKWINDLKTHYNGDLSEKILFLVGTKSDMDTERDVSYEDMLIFLKQNNINMLIECSAKKKQNIEKIFHNLIDKLRENETEEITIDEEDSIEVEIKPLDRKCCHII